ncbi:MAG: hypothetical protein IKT00_09265 [Prevotella sp.]|nr:hypothetical protein [Prevotella sp.]
MVDRFSTAVANNDQNTIVHLYPDAVKANGITLNYNRDSLRIEGNEHETEYLVTFAPNVWAKVVTDQNDSLIIKESKGLFSYPESKLKFAKDTGWYDENLNDVENAERLADEGFPDYLLKAFNASVKSGLKIIKTGTWGDDYYEGEWVSSKGVTFVVQNSSPYNVPGSAYNILYKEGYWGGGSMERETVPGQDVMAGQSVTLKTNRLGSSMESETGQTLNISDLSMDDFLSQFKPVGNEYEQYLQNGKEAPKAKQQISFVLEGIMGGCGTRITFDGQTGVLIYNPNGKTVDVGGMEQRTVTLISYNENTQRLVLKVENLSTKTGQLEGTWANGSYSGVFRNVNGKTSQFSFK